MRALEELKEGPQTFALWKSVFLWYCAPYLFGLMSFVIAARPSKPLPNHSSKRGRSIAVYFGFILLVCLSIALSGLYHARQIERDDLVYGSIWLAASIHWGRALCSGASGLLAIRWFMAVCCVAHFVRAFFFWDALYGLWLSLGGSLLIAGGCGFEAVARSALGWGATLRQLTAGRIAHFDIGGVKCARCGYLLVGLTAPRCPECGTPFEWDVERGLVPGLASQDRNVDNGSRSKGGPFYPA
jgi:hypothetical protein